MVASWLAGGDWVRRWITLDISVTVKKMFIRSWENTEGGEEMR
jgi:hypothetical protein